VGGAPARCDDDKQLTVGVRLFGRHDMDGTPVEVSRGRGWLSDGFAGTVEMTPREARSGSPNRSACTVCP